MAFRIFSIRCDECGHQYFIRRPASDKDLVQVIAKSKCPYCHPDSLNAVCPACLIPFSATPKKRPHANGLCFACYMREARYKKPKKDTIDECTQNKKLSTSTPRQRATES